MIGSSTVKPEDQKWWQKAASLRGRLYAVYAAGIAASFSALFELAVNYGGWLTPFGVTLPIVIDLYWITALQVALDSGRTTKQRWLAAVHAFLAISLSITGNIMYHELDTGSWHMDSHAHGTLVATLACIPVILTGTLTHLVLLAQQKPAAAGTAVLAPAGTTPVPATGTTELVPAAPSTGSKPTSGPVPGTTPEPVPVTAEPAGVDAGSGSGHAAAPAAKTERAARREPGSSQTVTPTADRRTLRAAVVEEFAALPLPPVEDVTARVARAEKFLAEFREKTGARMSNQELATALHVHKGRAAEIRSAVTEPEEEQPAKGEEGVA